MAFEHHGSTSFIVKTSISINNESASVLENNWNLPGHPCGEFLVILAWESLDPWYLDLLF